MDRKDIKKVVPATTTQERVVLEGTPHEIDLITRGLDKLLHATEMDLDEGHIFDQQRDEELTAQRDEVKKLLADISVKG